MDNVPDGAINGQNLCGVAGNLCLPTIISGCASVSAVRVENGEQRNTDDGARIVT